MARFFQVAGVLLLVAGAGLAEQKGGRVPRAPGVPKGNLKNAGKMANPANPAAILLRMTPEERERFLERLPPRQQAAYRQRLANLDSLSPAEKERIIRQSEVLATLPPETQQRISRQIMALNALPVERRVPVKTAVVLLRSLPESDRDARMNSEQFKQRFSPEEQQIISDLVQGLPPDYPIAGPRPGQ